MPARDHKHEAIAAELRQRITSGHYAPGARLPSGRDLATTYDVAANTVRDALRILQLEGLVEVRHGAGAFVRSYAPIIRFGQRRVASEVWGSGQSPWDIDARAADAQATDVTVDRTPVPAEYAAALNLPYDTEVVRRSRVYVVRDRAVMVATSYLPVDLAGGTQIEQVDTGPGGIYLRLRELGHAPARFREEIRSRPPTVEEARRLRLPAATYVLHIVRTAYDADDRPVELNDMTADPAVYVLTYEFDA